MDVEEPNLLMLYISWLQLTSYVFLVVACLWQMEKEWNSGKIRACDRQNGVELSSSHVCGRQRGGIWAIMLKRGGTLAVFMLAEEKGWNSGMQYSMLVPDKEFKVQHLFVIAHL